MYLHIVLSFLLYTVYAERQRFSFVFRNKKRKRSFECFLLFLSVTETDADAFCRTNEFAVHRHECRLFRYFFERDFDDGIILKRDHDVCLACKKCFGRGNTESRCEHAVVCRRRTAALEMSERGASRFNVAEFRELFRKDVADEVFRCLLCALRRPFRRRQVLRLPRRRRG